MAKTKTVARPEVRHKRRPADQEQVTRLLVMGGVLAVVLIAAGIIGFGWYQTKVKPLGKTVLTVGNMDYSLGALERRMELMKNDNPSYYSGQILLLLPRDAIDQLTLQAKFLQAASTLKVTVSEEEFASEIKSQGNVSEDAEPDVYAAAYRQLWKDSGLHQGEYRDKVQAELLEQKLSDYFRFVAKPSEAEIKGNYSILDGGKPESETEAAEIMTRVRAGEDFQTVSKEVIGDQGTGTFDWTPRGGTPLLADEVEAYLFDTAQLNGVSDVIEVDDVLYVVQLTDRDPNRTLDDRGRQIAGQRDMAKWLDGLNITVNNKLSEEDENKAISDIL